MRLLAFAVLVLALFASVGYSHSVARRRHHAAPKEPIAPPAAKTEGGVDNSPIEDGEDNGTDQDNDENPTPPLSKPAVPSPTPVTAAPAPTPATANGDIPAAGLAGPDSNNSGVQDPSEANANAVRNDNGLFCSNVGPRHLTLQCKEHPDGNCCGSAGFCCPKDHFCSLDADGHATSKCVKRRKQIVISPTIIIHTGANGLNINGLGASASASTALPDGVDTSDEVDDSDANEDSGLEDQDYNANSQLDVVPHRTGSLSHPRRDKIVLVMKNRNKITRGKKHQADKDDEGNDDDDDDSDDGADAKTKKDATKEDNTDADATDADPTGAAKNVPANK